MIRRRPQELMAERIRVLLEHGDTVILLAGEPPCALSVTRFRPGLWSPKLEAYLAELYVVPDRRGQGIGRALMERDDGRRARAGADTMELGTGEGDVAARGLYESLGFHHTRARARGCADAQLLLRARALGARDRGPSASKNLAMIGPSSGPPLTPPLSWTTMAKAMSPR